MYVYVPHIPPCVNEPFEADELVSGPAFARLSEALTWVDDNLLTVNRSVATDSVLGWNKQFHNSRLHLCQRAPEEPEGHSYAWITRHAFVIS